jgi:hypothetical protein
VIESAFMIPIMVMLVFGAISLGSMLHTRHAMMHAARDAARMLSVGGGTVAEAEQAAADLLPSGSYGFLVEASAPGPGTLDREVWVEITVPYADIAVGDVLGVFGSERMRVRVVMRSEQ